ncbi:MAG TPA: hypothetical protein VF618_21815 [Thermoanaerobaculia bacterium]
MTTLLSTRHLIADSATAAADAFPGAPAVSITETAKGHWSSSSSRSTTNFQARVEDHDDCRAPELIGPGDSFGNQQVANPVRFRWSGGRIDNDDTPEFRILYTVGGGNAKEEELGRTFQDEFVASLPAGEIKWRVMIGSGGESCTSGSLKFNALGSCQAPAVTASASKTSAVAGESITITANVTGTAASSITWYEGTNSIGTGATLTRTVTTSTSFHCVVTNPCGTAQSAPVAVSVCSPASITTHPSSTTIVEGNTATLGIAVDGTQPLTIKWYEGANVVGSGPSFTTPTLTQTKTYRAEVANACGTATSSSATVTVTAACTAPTLLAPSQIAIEEGATATLAVTVTGTEPVTIEWFRDNTSVGSGPSFTTPALTQTTPFRVQATNACGTANATIVVQVERRANCNGHVPVPAASAVARARTGIPYEIGWPSLGAGLAYEVEESSSANFTNSRVVTTQAQAAAFRHDVTEPAAFFYRVRAVRTCDGAFGEHSEVLRVVVLPQSQSPTDFVAPYGTLSLITRTLHLDAATLGGAGTTFLISTSEPWMSIAPQSGLVPAGGVTFTLIIDPRDMPQGTSAASLRIGTLGGALRTNDTTSSRSVPVTVSLVTPVRPAPRPSGDDLLVIPAVAHAAGNQSQWQSDVRLAHTWPIAMRYELTFTTTGADGSKGMQTTVTVNPNQTLALDDLLARWFGAGALNDSMSGLLLVRPLDTPVAPGRTIAASRLYNKAAQGSFGQFIAAVPLSRFIANGAHGLTLTQLAQSDAFRTNFGIVEGSGKAARVKVEAFDHAGAKLFESMLDLLPGEHRQLGAFFAANNVSTANARVNVSVVSSTGRAYAYASVVDNKTGDPSFIPAFNSSSATTHVIAGAADLATATGRWQTDLRLFNTTSASVATKLEFYPQGATTPTVTRELTLQPGETRAADDVLRTLFEQNSIGGAIRVTTALAGAVVPTARTYHNRGDGTYGQFIRGASSTDALTLGDQPRFILHAEESPRFRTNIGLAEVNGADANVELSVTLPGRRIATIVQVPLKANEYRQLNSMLKTLGMEDAYNATVSLRVIGGSGKVVAYGSVVDNVTQDPTYVMAE